MSTSIPSDPPKSTTGTSGFSIPIPKAVSRFFSYFPLHSYPAIHPAPPAPAPVSAYSVPIYTGPLPVLWISPPKPDLLTIPSTNPLSADVECLKWQAYIALRGVKGVGIRWDISPDGAVDGQLPNLQIPFSGDAKEAKSLKGQVVVEDKGKVIGARTIPTWVDEQLGVSSADEEFEGYRDIMARDESRAWIALLEGAVHAALVSSRLPSTISIIQSIFFPFSSSSVSPTSSTGLPALSTYLTPPPAPLSGLSSILPPFGEHISPTQVQSQYYDAIASISERLGKDTWFLGSANPTPLDALLFAYLHTLLDGPDSVRVQVTRRVNLVAYEKRVWMKVAGAFEPEQR